MGWVTGLDPPMFQMEPRYWRPMWQVTDNQIDPHINWHTFQRAPNILSWLTLLCNQPDEEWFSIFICISPWYWWWGENMGRFEESESLLSSNFIEGAAAALLLCYCGSWYFHTCCCTARARRVHRSLTSCHFHTCIFSIFDIFTLAYFHICIFSHLHTFTFAHFHTCILAVLWSGGSTEVWQGCCLHVSFTLS